MSRAVSIQPDHVGPLLLLLWLPATNVGLAYSLAAYPRCNASAGRRGVRGTAMESEVVVRTGGDPRIALPCGMSM